MPVLLLIDTSLIAFRAVLSLHLPLQTPPQLILGLRYNIYLREINYIGQAAQLTSASIAYIQIHQTAPSLPRRYLPS
jgi:hypothetical protein